MTDDTPALAPFGPQDGPQWLTEEVLARARAEGKAEGIESVNQLLDREINEWEINRQVRGALIELQRKISALASQPTEGGEDA